MIRTQRPGELPLGMGFFMEVGPRLGRVKKARRVYVDRSKLVGSYRLPPTKSQGNLWRFCG